MPQVKSYILLIVIVNAFSIQEAISQTIAKNGVVDLSKYTFEEITELNGEWDFYPNELVSSSEISQKKGLIVNVPDTWTNYSQSDSVNFPVDGYMTYHLRILLPQQSAYENYMFYFDQVSSSFDVWINGRKVASSGIVDTTRKTYRASNNHLLVYANPTRNILSSQPYIDLVLQVANYSHLYPGITTPVKFGTASKIEREQKTILIFSSFSLGTILLVMISHTVLYFFLRHDKSYLYFSINCLLIAIWAVTYNKIIHFFAPGINWEFIVSLEYASGYFAVASMILFALDLYPETQIQKTIAKFLVILGVCIGVFVMISPVKVFLKFKTLYDIYIIGTSLYFALFVILPQLYKKFKELRLIALGLFLLIAAAINDVLNSSEILHNGFYAQYFFTVFMLLISYSLHKKFTATFIDNTQLSSELEEQNKILEIKVNERTSELLARNIEIQNQSRTLQQTNEELKSRREEIEKQANKLLELNSHKDKILSIIGHDLRNPIGAIQSLTELFETQKESSEKDYLIKLIKESSGNAFALLENLLLWAKMQYDQTAPSYQNIHLKTIVDKSLTLLSVIANRKEITISTDIEEALHLYADPNMMETIIRNLISNALKFTPKNGNIAIKAFDFSGKTQIQVTDNGIGISKEDIAKILNDNDIGSSYGTLNEKGSGLGLKLCKSFVHLHKGEIWIESEYGKGTTFFVAIPKNVKRRKTKDLGTLLP